MPALNRISQTAPDAVTLLRVLCFCDPESIAISVLKRGCGALSPEDWRDLPTAPAVNDIEAVVGLFRSSIRLSKAIQEIQRLSLAVYTREGSERILLIHDLVQLLLRSKLIAAGEQEQWLEIVICVVCKACKEIGDPRSPQNWSQCGQVVSHIEFMGAFAAQYGLRDYGLRDTTLLDTSTWAAIYLNRCGLYQKAASMQVQTCERTKAVLGEDHPDTLGSITNVASAYLDLGRWKEAEELLVGVVEASKRILGEEHPQTLARIANLALTYFKQGRWKEAEGLQIRAIEANLKVLGEEHPDTLGSINNLAVTYTNQGRLEEAEGLVLNVFAIRAFYDGDEHPITLDSMVSLASIYSEQGRLEEAERLEVRALETRKRVLGEEHPDTAGSMNNLACTWERQGQHAKAIGLMDECVHLRTRVFGPNHPDTLVSSANLARMANTRTPIHLERPGLDTRGYVGTNLPLFQRNRRTSCTRLGVTGSKRFRRYRQLVVRKGPRKNAGARRAILIKLDEHKLSGVRVLESSKQIVIEVERIASTETGQTETAPPLFSKLCERSNDLKKKLWDA